MQIMRKLEVRNLTQTFAQKDTQLQVLEGLNFSIDEGQFVALLGALRLRQEYAF